MKYFKIEEFNCDGVICYDKMDVDLLRMLDQAREYANTPFKLTSTWRSVEKNNSLKNSSKNSSHLKGRAVDIACTNSRSRALIIGGLVEAGFTRIGIGNTFLHCDLADQLGDKKKDEIVFWMY